MVKRIALSALIALTACNVSLFSSSEHGVCGVDAAVDSMAFAPDAAVDAPPDAPPDAAATPFGILIIGQSNAEGRKACTSVTLSTHACDVRAWARFWDRDTDSPIDPFTWQVSRDDVSLSPRTGNNFGVELSLADELHANALTFAIAKNAVGSTALAANWDNHCYTSPSAVADVGCTYHNPTTGLAQPYPSAGSSLPQMALDQGAKLDAAGFPVKYILWIQGETDASYSTYSQLFAAPQAGFVSHYDQNLTAWFQQLHAQWPDALIVFNELDSAMVFNRTSDLRTAQEATAARLSYTRLISSEGLPIDSAHFQADGLWTLGQRFADAILAP